MCGTSHAASARGRTDIRAEWDFGTDTDLARPPGGFDAEAAKARPAGRCGYRNGWRNAAGGRLRRMMLGDLWKAAYDRRLIAVYRCLGIGRLRLIAGGWRLMAGGWGMKAGGRGRAADGRRLVAGGWRMMAGAWRRMVVGWRLMGGG